MDKTNPSSGEVVKTVRVMRLPELMTRTGLPRATVYHLMKHGDLPKNFALGPRVVGWLESEVEAWISLKAAARVGVATAAVRQTVNSDEKAELKK